MLEDFLKALLPLSFSLGMLVALLIIKRFFYIRISISIAPITVARTPGTKERKGVIQENLTDNLKR